MPLKFDERVPTTPCHSERSEESKMLTWHSTLHPRFFAALRMTRERACANPNRSFLIGGSIIQA